MQNHVILFKDANFHGDHKHVFDQEANLNRGDDNEFNDNVSSIVILSGNWRFFKDSNFANPYSPILGPGLYRFVEKVKIANDDLSSLRSVPNNPTMVGDPLDGHAVLFEHANFHGDHRHIFAAETNLGDNGFNDTTSSIVIESGSWAFYRDSQFDGNYPPVLGPGIYPWVEDVGIKNDDMSSLRPSASQATISNAVENEVLLFEHNDFHGSHKHVFAAEPNLNAPDDNFFNDRVSSIVVLAGTWSFFADSNFIAPYPGSALTVGSYPSVTNEGIQNDDMSSLRPAIPVPARLGDPITGHVILFENSNFHGRHRHIFNAESNLNASDDSSFNDSVSSIVVLSGNWQFFRNAGFDDNYPSILGPGLYSWVEDFDIRNDDMSSLRTVEQEPNVTGAPLNAHIVLFEHANFHGAHKHIFGPEPNLNADDDHSFNDITSSIAVLAGTWATFADSQFQRPYPPLIGPGLYPWVADPAVQIKNDDLSSLQPTEREATVLGTTITGRLILFEHANFHGAHKHILNVEENLDAGDDNSFNDVTSSIAVLQNEWLTYRDVNLQRPYDVILGEGLFAWVENVSIANDDLSSLTVAGERRQFSGTATINIASGQVPEPVVLNVAMGFLFYPDNRRFLIDAGFGTLQINGLGTIRYDGAKDGMFPPDGQVSIPDIKITGSASGFSEDTMFTLTTGTQTSPSGRYMVTGSPADSPADGLGNVRMVATGNLAGDDFSIELMGAFTPRS